MSRGRELFERNWVKNDPRGHGGDGLGPVFNAQSCLDCHSLGGSGGAGGIDRNIEIATATESPAMGGLLLRLQHGLRVGPVRVSDGFPPALGTRPTPDRPEAPGLDPPGVRGGPERDAPPLRDRPRLPDLARVRARPARHGLGPRLPAEPDAPVRNGPDRRDPRRGDRGGVGRKFPGSAGVRGRVSRLKDGRIGRFGWKAKTASLEEFVLSAAAGEMGLEIPGRHQAADPRLPGLAASGLDMDEEDCEALVDHVRSLPAPVAIPPADDADAAQVKAGESTFKSIGCTGCHVPRLGDVEGIYSDLLLHDMGPQPVDADAYAVFVGDAPKADDRPVGAGSALLPRVADAPLWGLRDSGPYLHDGRAARIDQAVALHAGQGASSSRRYAELSPRRKRQVEVFLMSLAAPPRSEGERSLAGGAEHPCRSFRREPFKSRLNTACERPYVGLRICKRLNFAILTRFVITPSAQPSPRTNAMRLRRPSFMVAGGDGRGDHRHGLPGFAGGTCLGGGAHPPDRRPNADPPRTTWTPSPPRDLLWLAREANRPGRYDEATRHARAAPAGPASVPRCSARPG